MIEKLQQRIRMCKRYFAYRNQARNAFKIHSPFMYDVYTRVIKDKTRHADYDKVEKIRHEFFHSKQRIHVLDLGAKKQSGEKNISQIAKNALKSPKNARLIYRLVQHFNCKNILELGTSLGITTSYMAHANPEARILSIEGCRETAKAAQKGWKLQHLHNIDIITGDFSDVIPEALSTMPSIDLIFFDGNHQKQPTLDYFHTLLPHTHENSLLIFDDIHWSSDMEDAWKTITEHPQVHVSIDLFQMGIIFLNPKYCKQHYVLHF